MYLLDVQKKLYLNNCLNRENDGATLNVICRFSKSIDPLKLRECIINVFNANALIKSCIRITNSEYTFIDNEKYPYEIEINKRNNDNIRINDLFEHPIFHYSYNLTKDKSYIHATIIEGNIENFLLISCHHIIMDAFSSLSIFKQIYNGYANNKFNNFDKSEIIIMHNQLKKNYVNSKVKSFNNFNKRLGSSIYEPIPLSMHEGDYVIANFDINPKAKNLPPRHLTAIGVYCLTLALCKFYKMDNYVIGVPVPNISKDNIELVSCTSNVLPVIISSEDLLNIPFSEMINNISYQLFNNLKNQYFDFISNFKNTYLNNNYIASVTYYPSDFIFANKNIFFDFSNIFSPVPPHESHVIFKNSNKVTIETKLGKKLVNLIIMHLNNIISN